MAISIKNPEVDLLIDEITEPLEGWCVIVDSSALLAIVLREGETDLEVA